MSEGQRCTIAGKAAAFAEIADAVLAAEGASDTIIAATATLLTKAAAHRVATGVPILAAQRVLDQLEKMVMSQFDSRRALLAAHSNLRAIAKVSRDRAETGWGPDSTCPQQAIGGEMIALRAVA